MPSLGVRSPCLIQLSKDLWVRISTACIFFKLALLSKNCIYDVRKISRHFFYKLMCVDCKTNFDFHAYLAFLCVMCSYARDGNGLVLYIGNIGGSLVLIVLPTP